ncbi:VWA domain-containing protein [Paraburkholderia sp. EG287A]|uniref:VWA domain-containing protein n=1 Tax=Paraburkholderia sp. EG287A TaxID=3237012 RepID=UPI0034D182F5
MALVLNLEKATQSLVLNLQKVGVTTPPELEVGIAMDVSKSFEDEHDSGITTDLTTRLIPWGLAFDPDKKVDICSFSDGPNHVVDVGPITEKNYVGFMHNKVIGKVAGWNGNTDYSYFIEHYLRLFGWLPTEQKPGFFAGLFGAKAKLVQGPKRKSLVLAVTDGANADKLETEQVLRESQARGDEVFFLFLGVSNQGGSFPFLRKLDGVFSNVGFVQIENLKEFVSQSDDELNESLISDKLIEWLKA